MPNMGISSKALKSRPPRNALAPRTSLADALFTSTQQRVLGYLFGQTDRSFFANELIALTGAGSGAVQRELRRLVESGLVTSHVIGRERHYQANTAAPIFEELRGIIVKTSGVVEPLLAALEPLKDQLTLALLYGSVAKGTATTASDLDVMIVSDDLHLEDLYGAFESVERKLKRKINPTLYSNADFKRRRQQGNAFLSRVLAGAHIPLIGSMDAVEAAG